MAEVCNTGKARLVVGDIGDRALVNELTAGVDIVFHQAALRITHCAADPRLGVDVMVTGTLNVVQAAVDAGVTKVVAASSASIYGQAPSFPTVETDHGYDNRTLYGAAKMFNEGLLRSYNDMFGLDYVALRYFNVYGPRMDIHGVYTEVLVRWMERIEAGLPPLIFGDGQQTMDFVYITDVARANLLAATRRCDRQGLQRCDWSRDEPRRPGAGVCSRSWAAISSPSTDRSATSTRWPVAWRPPRLPPAISASRPKCRCMTDWPNWSIGGGPPGPAISRSTCQNEFEAPVIPPSFDRATGDIAGCAGHHDAARNGPYWRLHS